MRLICVLLGLLALPAWAQPYAYIPNSGSSTVSVVDDATGSVVDTINLTGTSPWGVAVSPDASLVYAGNRSSFTISAIDTATNTEVATIPGIVGPLGIVFSPDGTRAYAAEFDGGFRVVAIDTAAHAIVDSLLVGGSPYGLAVTPDSSKLYISNYSADTVSVIDTASFTLSTTIPVGIEPLQLAVTPDGGRLVVANGYSNNLAIIDTATDTVIDTIPIGFRAAGVAVSNDGATAVVTSDSSSDIAIVDLAGGALATTVPVGGGSWGVDFTPDGSRVYVTLFSDSVLVLDAATLVVLDSIALGLGPFAHGNFFATSAAAPPPPVAQGVQLDANPGAPVIYAEEIIASPGASVTLLNPAGDLNLSANLGYSFSIGEVRYARFECDSGLVFDAGSAATYDGAGSAGLGAINGLGGSVMHFSITANDNNVTADDRLVINGDRRIIGTDADINCSYGLYDFPSQAAAGGPNGRVYSVSGPYVRFAPSYGLVVDVQGNPVADVESNEPAYSEFEITAPTFNEARGRIGGFSYGTAADLGLGTQPITIDGTAVELADLMHGDTALVFAGDFSIAADVFFSTVPDCAIAIQSADDFVAAGAIFTIGANPALNHFLCYETSGNPIRASAFTVALAPVSADDTTYEVLARGPLVLGAITRNGTELQAPLAQIPGGWLSRLVLTNRGTQDREYEIAVFGETGTTISTNNLTGTVEAESTLVVDLDTVLTGFTGGLPRATLNVTIAAPNNTIQGLYQIVNPDTGSISSHVMVRPGTH